MAGEPALTSSDSQQCLLNLNFDMNVQKLLQVANDDEQGATPPPVTKRSTKRTAAAPTVSTSGPSAIASAGKRRPGLVSNVTIGADK